MKTKKESIKRDPEKTQAAILQQATRIFARSGFHGTGLNEICQKAKVNKRMIYHYFGNKLGLYRAVHARGWRELQEWFAKELMQPEVSPPGAKDEALLLRAVRIFHDFMASHQLFLRLLLWDGLEEGAISRSLWQEVRGPIYHQMEVLLEEAQNKGVLSKGLQASHLIISFMGAISFYYSHAHTMGDIFRKNPLSPEAVEERKEQVLALFQKLMD
ncbi:MAG: TetR/AcrR family transcriptional regulator [bacterium]